MRHALLLSLACLLAPAGALRVQAEREDGVFRNVLLVLHCRLKYLDNRSICDERRPLFEGYRKFFGDMMYITRQDCAPGAGDPYSCIAAIMRGQGAARDGVFYMHFDALIRPRALAKTFKLDHISAFNAPRPCRLDSKMSMLDCHWVHWSSTGSLHGKRYREAVEELRATLPPELSQFARTDEVSLGNDDLFYIPRGLYRPWGQLAEVFMKHYQPHESAGPTMRSMLSRAYGVHQDDLQCWGDCCKSHTAEVALDPNFVCGHVFDLRSYATRKAFQTVIGKNVSMIRRTAGAVPPSTAALARIVELALA